MSSWLPFEWIAASRFLREGRLQTIFIMLGVAIGVGVIIFMSAALAGQQANVIRRVLSAQAHIVLLPPKEVARPLRAAPGLAQAAIVQQPFQRLKSIDQWQKIIAEVDRMGAVSAVSPMAAGSMLAVRGEATRAVTVMGVDAEDIIVGTELATELGVSVGDKLRIVPNVGEGATLTISGIIDLGNKGANQRNTYVALHTAQGL